MQAIITEEELRQFAKDTPELNTLVDTIRFTSKDIDRAIVSVVDRFNILTPPSGMYTVETFPSRALLTLGVWGWLLRGAAIGEGSNNLTYAADGVSVNDRDKAELFTSLGNSFWQEFIEASKAMKLTQSINRAYGRKGSEYGSRYF